MSGPTVPVEWTRMIGNRRAAQVANDVVRSPDATEAEKAKALQHYGEMSDAVMADLSLLSEAGVLARITFFLSKRERA